MLMLLCFRKSLRLIFFVDSRLWYTRVSVRCVVMIVLKLSPEYGLPPLICLLARGLLPSLCEIFLHKSTVIDGRDNLVHDGLPFLVRSSSGSRRKETRMTARGTRSSRSCLVGFGVWLWLRLAVLSCVRAWAIVLLVVGSRSWSFLR